ncbi:hypothetical protein [Hyphomicrobium sp. CS1BSMeth3]|uniref:DUF6881 domain-containing protein n=1 Tax=Hyphomicrobium sp. CS1BSMeth3 TaxID=1892844 RepID=UPI000931365E
MSEHTYIRVQWLHGLQDEPVELWSELDKERFETRKLEVFRNGAVGYASASEAVEGTMLGTVPVPSLAEIAADSQFRPEEIPQSEFENRWLTRRCRSCELAFPAIV